MRPSIAGSGGSGKGGIGSKRGEGNGEPRVIRGPFNRSLIHN